VVLLNLVLLALPLYWMLHRLFDESQFHHQGLLEKTVTWAEALSCSMISRKFHWIWSDCVAILLLLNPSLLLCAQLQDGSGFVIFQENKSLVTGSLVLYATTLLCHPMEMLHNLHIFSLLFFSLCVCVRERERERMNTWFISWGPGAFITSSWRWKVAW
jgi:hypothetical protein